MHLNKGIKDRPIPSGVQCVHGKNGEGTLPGSSNAGEGPLFKFADGRPLTRERFVDNISVALVAAGINPAPYSGHSFRIGAATTAAKKGVGDFHH